MKNPMMLKCLLVCCLCVAAWLPAEAVTVRDVTAYGATGNGTTDDTASIQAAFTAVPSGGEIYFPPGRYLISNTLTLASTKIGVTIKMSGGFGPYAGQTSSDRGIFWSSTAPTGLNMLNLAPTSGTTQLIGLCLDGGSGANQPTGLYLDSGNSVTCTGVWIRNCGVGMNFQGGQSGAMNFYNCFITNCNACVYALPSATMLFDSCFMTTAAGNNGYYCIYHASAALQLVNTNFGTTGSQSVIETVPYNDGSLPVCSLTITGGHHESSSFAEHYFLYYNDTTLSRSGPISITGFGGDGDVYININPAQNVLLACNLVTGLTIVSGTQVGQHYCNLIEGINYTPPDTVPSTMTTSSTGPDSAYDSH